MTLAATFLGGASGRLLPMSVPFRFFGAAAVYHVFAWMALAATGGAWVEFHGGLGVPLAAIHLFTLGTLVMTALGAGAQLMPVATRQSPVGAAWLKAIWWIYTPAVAVLAIGMAEGYAAALVAGSAGVAFALAAWLVLMAKHLLGARGMPGVRAHAWGALVSLAFVLATGVALAALWAGVPTASRDWLLHAHLVVAPLGFMGLLSIGLSSILVPMFALSPAPPERAQLASFALIAIAVVLACESFYTVAWIFGATGVAWHLVSMQRAMASGMRKDLGLSFVVVRFGWAALVLSLLLVPADITWWIAAALCWLASVLFGFLQRIVPFLGALHAGAGKRRGPTASSLTHTQALRIHSYAHIAAWCGIGLALGTGSRLAGEVAALAGIAASGAFAWFFAHLIRRSTP